MRIQNLETVFNIDQILKILMLNIKIKSSASELSNKAVLGINI